MPTYRVTLTRTVRQRVTLTVEARSGAAAMRAAEIEADEAEFGEPDWEIIEELQTATAIQACDIAAE